MKSDDKLLTPCCNATLSFTYGWHGGPYTGYELVDTVFCSGENCYNEWDLEGNLI